MQDSSLRQAIDSQLDGYERALRHEMARVEPSRLDRSLGDHLLRSALVDPYPAWVAVTTQSDAHMRSAMIVTDDQEGYGVALDLTDATFVVVRKGGDGFEATGISGDVVKCLLALTDLRRLKHLLFLPLATERELQA